jgi:hypothetical protein
MVFYRRTFLHIENARKRDEQTREPRHQTKKDLVWSPRRGYADFTVPLFAEYARANHPWEGFEDG